MNFFLSDKKDAQLLGYLVYTRQGNVAKVFDLLAADQADYDVVLLLFALRMRRDGVHVISLAYLGSESFERCLRRLHFVRRNGARELMAFLHVEQLGDRAAKLLSKDQYFMLDGDLDL